MYHGVQNPIVGFALCVNYLINKTKLHLASPISDRLNGKSSESQRQINCTAKFFMPHRSILWRGL